MPVHTHTHKYTYVRTYVRTYIRTYLLTYVHTYVRTYLLTYVHTYIRTYIHTYIHTYIPLKSTRDLFGGLDDAVGSTFNKNNNINCTTSLLLYAHTSVKYHAH